MKMNGGRILLIGNSHVEMISEALAEEGGDPNITVRWLKTKRYGDTSREEAEREIASLGSGDLLVLTRLGTMSSIMGLFEHPQPYSLFDPEQHLLHAPSDRDILPISLLRSHLRSKMTCDEILSPWSENAPCPTLHYLAPPPKRTMKRAGKMRATEEGKVFMAFNDPWNRLAFWKAEADVAAAYLADVGIEACPVPEGTMDEDGFLKEPYHANDAQHANAAYGALLLEQFRTRLGATSR